MKIIGILNVTPDSFSGDGVYLDAKSALKQAEKMVEDGANFIDVGGESTRPGYKSVSLEDELARVIPVASELSKVGIPFSVDTQNARVARECLDFGAVMTNSISAGDDLLSLAKEYRVPIVLMHGARVRSPCIDVVKDYLSAQAGYARSIGVERIVLDVGFGFGKRAVENWELLREFETFTSIDYQFLAALSRKGFVKQYGLMGTLFANYVALQKGAEYIRVHDVKEHRSMVDALGNLRNNL